MERERSRPGQVETEQTEHGELTECPIWRGEMTERNRAPSSRSSDLRSQRAVRSKDRITQASERARHPVNVRPVTVRGNMAGTNAKRRTQGNVRRKTYYTLNTAGAE